MRRLLLSLTLAGLVGAAGCKWTQGVCDCAPHGAVHHTGYYNGYDGGGGQIGGVAPVGYGYHGQPAGSITPSPMNGIPVESAPMPSSLPSAPAGGSLPAPMPMAERL